MCTARTNGNCHPQNLHQISLFLPEIDTVIHIFGLLPTLSCTHSNHSLQKISHQFSPCVQTISASKKLSHPLKFLILSIFHTPTMFLKTLHLKSIKPFSFSSSHNSYLSASCNNLNNQTFSTTLEDYVTQFNLIGIKKHISQETFPMKQLLHIIQIIKAFFSKWPIKGS